MGSRALTSSDNTITGPVYYRSDGIRITHNPYTQQMIEKYGKPGKTDNEGFDPYRDSVGPGIYGGRVKRDERFDNKIVIIGKQYQNHNPRPGPVYAGGGYTPVVDKLKDSNGLNSFLLKYPDLVNDITTGGASPLHMCGMGRDNERSTKLLIQHGADIESLDTYGMTPLHRMASNNLAVAAEMLLRAGADVEGKGLIGEIPMGIARGSEAKDVIEVLKKYQNNSKRSSKGDNNIVELRVDGAEILSTTGPSNSKSKDDNKYSEIPLINGIYKRQSPSIIPSGFTKVCDQMNWNSQDMWNKLNGGNNNNGNTSVNPWFKHTENESYIYYNLSDKKWWIDGPSGNGIFIVQSPSHAPAAHGWKSLVDGDSNVNVIIPPMVRTFRKVEGWESLEEMNMAMDMGQKKGGGSGVSVEIDILES